MTNCGLNKHCRHLCSSLANFYPVIFQSSYWSTRLSMLMPSLGATSYAQLPRSKDVVTLKDQQPKAPQQTIFSDEHLRLWMPQTFSSGNQCRTRTSLMYLDMYYKAGLTTSYEYHCPLLSLKIHILHYSPLKSPVTSQLQEARLSRTQDHLTKPLIGNVNLLSPYFTFSSGDENIVQYNWWWTSTVVLVLCTLMSAVVFSNIARHPASCQTGLHRSSLAPYFSS